MKTKECTSCGAKALETIDGPIIRHTDHCVNKEVKIEIYYNKERIGLMSEIRKSRDIFSYMDSLSFVERPMEIAGKIITKKEHMNIFRKQECSLQILIIDENRKILKKIDNAWIVGFSETFEDEEVVIMKNCKIVYEERASCRAKFLEKIR